MVMVVVPERLGLASSVIVTRTVWGPVVRNVCVGDAAVDVLLAPEVGSPKSHDQLRTCAPLLVVELFVSKLTSVTFETGVVVEDVITGTGLPVPTVMPFDVEACCVRSSVTSSVSTLT